MHVVGALAAQLAFLPLGVGVLLLSGGSRLARGVLRVGVALFVGLAAGAVVLPWLLYVGVSPTIPVVLLLGALALAVGVVVTRRRRSPVSGRGEETEPASIGPLGLLVIAAPLVLLAVDRLKTRISAHDAWANWMLKARLLYYDGGTFLGALDHRAFAVDSTAGPGHREYPLGVPALAAVALHGASGNVQGAALLYPVLLGGFALVMWTVLQPHVPQWPLLAGISLVLWLPMTRQLALAATGDLPIGVFFVAAALLFVLWLAEETPGALPLAALCGAAALACKRDALADCAVLAAVALVETVRLRRPDLARRMAIALALMFLSIVPWRLWVSLHHLRNQDVSFGSKHLARNLDQIGFIVAQLGHNLVDGNLYAYVVPIAGVAAALALTRGRSRRLSAAAAVFGLGLFAVLIVVYLNATVNLAGLVLLSATRTLYPLSLFAAAVLPLLVVRALGSGGDSGGGSGAGGRALGDREGA
jgi:hypothetical protein